MIARSPQPRSSVLGVLGELLCQGVNFWGYLPQYLAGIGRNLSLAAEIEKAIKTHAQELGLLNSDSTRTRSD